MKFYGLIGEKLTHSLSPQLHKTIYKRTSTHAAYKNFPVPADQVEQAVNSLRVLSISGSNVTIPYKETVIPFLDEIDPTAENLGVVNTILNTNGYLKGFNTDYEGFGLLFKRRNWDLNGRHVTILGTGGSSKMVVQYVKDHGAKSITLVSRSSKAVLENSLITYKTYDELSDSKGDYLINTTPVGMFPNMSASPVTAETITRFNACIDLIYNPLETTFLKQAKDQGKPAVNGLEMLVGQAVKSVEIWENRTFSETLVEELVHDYTHWKEG
ncbi:shikimate dehydrogenase family protein [Alkalibacterium olivapovliticus]|uniref:Shikimate dehydrogenase (NADP(+)) n=1 Tax=Alkalibacterium olivapovliticus TaxID=99907 RepID=A0A2T0W6J7_9LACT|nr:shikimate dehydrogenase [Alkalibacterium olivapovliticus]PRY82312.1 shikimate dehydrogenase [Alkalibacterium olivapovliticus]